MIIKVFSLLLPVILFAGCRSLQGRQWNNDGVRGDYILEIRTTRSLPVSIISSACPHVKIVSINVMEAGGDFIGSKTMEIHLSEIQPLEIQNIITAINQSGSVLGVSYRKI